MSITESDAWESLRPVLGQALGLDPVRVENISGSGTPDVNITLGWIELKSVPQWPKYDKTPVDVGMERGQPPWLRQRWLAGGACWVMVRFEKKEWLLFSGLDAPHLRFNSGPTQTQLRRMACASFVKLRSSKEEQDTLRHWLNRDFHALPPPSSAKLLRMLSLKSVDEVARERKVTADVIWSAEQTYDSAETNNLIDYWLA